MHLRPILFAILTVAGLRTQADVCHTLEALRAGKENAYLPGLGFDFTGQVINISLGAHPFFNVHDPTSDRVVEIHDLRDNPSPLQNGDRIRLFGVTHRNDAAAQNPGLFATTFHATNLVRIGKFPFPETLPITAREINSPRVQNRFVRIDGVLASVRRDPTDARWNWLVLRTEDGSIHASASEHDFPYKGLLHLIDADVRLRGRITSFATWRQALGKHILLRGSDGIELLTPAPPPFSVPPMAGREDAHRRRTTARVLACSRGRVFLRDTGGVFLVALPADGETLPTAGETATVSGFVEFRLNGCQLTSAVFRRLPEPVAPPDPARTTVPDELFTTDVGRDIVNADFYGKVIRLRGRVANSTEGLRTDGRIVLECGTRTVDVEISHLLDRLDPLLGNGCMIDVSGICLVTFETTDAMPLFPTFRNFSLTPRSPDDIVVVRRPPWWTPLRLLGVIAVLVVLIVVILVWNRLLQLLSERRGRELYREQIASARADLQVEERTRLAIELHDSISQSLTGVALQIDAASKTGKANPSAAERFLETARTMLASCRQELRCCIWDLKSRTFDEKDMTEAVQKTLAPHLGNAELSVRFNVPRQILSESAAHDTLRIIRELATNALRHGQARHLRIAGEYRDGSVRFSVRDDGTGFDPSSVPGPADGHFGLQGIRERVKNRNGELQVESTPGQGTKVTVTLTADEKEDDER